MERTREGKRRNNQEKQGIRQGHRFDTSSHATWDGCATPCPALLLWLASRDLAQSTRATGHGGANHAASGSF